jgi:hypothetical protein
VRRPLLSRVDRWIFDSHALDRESLAIYRVLYASFVIVFALPCPTWTSRLPPEVFDPPKGMMRLLDGFPPAPAIRLASFALCCALVALLVGWRTRLASIVVCVLLFGLAGLDYCFGIVHHTRHMMMLTPLALAFSAWGSALAVDAAHRARPPAPLPAWPLAWLALLLGLYFWSGGWPKVEADWLDPSLQAVRYQLGLRSSLPLDRLPDVVWEAMDVIIVVFECGFVLATLSLRGTRIACCMAVLFHVTNLTLLGIDFQEQLVVYGAFVPWSRVPLVAGAVRRAAARAAPLRRAPGVAVLGLGFVVFVLNEWVGSPLSTSEPWPRAARFAYWTVPAAVAIWHLAREARSALGATRSALGAARAR